MNCCETDLAYVYVSLPFDLFDCGDFDGEAFFVKNCKALEKFS